MMRTISRLPLQPLILILRFILLQQLFLTRQTTAFSILRKTFYNNYNYHLGAHRHDNHDLSLSGPVTAVSLSSMSSSATITITSGTLGDIMTGGLTTDTGSGGTLANQFNITSPMDRILVTANGNLQRIVSSWYDAPVHVVVQYCHFHPDQQYWERSVQLQIHNNTILCTAQSNITIHSGHCQQLVQTGQVGLGQLFRHLNRLPTFTLIEAGYHQGGLWRRYQLICQEITCDIVEHFVPNMWDFGDTALTNRLA